MQAHIYRDTIISYENSNGNSLESPEPVKCRGIKYGD